MVCVLVSLSRSRTSLTHPPTRRTIARLETTNQELQDKMCLMEQDMAQAQAGGGGLRTEIQLLRQELNISLGPLSRARSLSPSPPLPFLARDLFLSLFRVRTCARVRESGRVWTLFPLMRVCTHLL